ncbi:hypothetical protein GQ457_14G002330 [Hibiscus cannabinus]
MVYFYCVVVLVISAPCRAFVAAVEGYLAMTWCVAAVAALLCWSHHRLEGSVNPREWASKDDHCVWIGHLGEPIVVIRTGSEAREGCL